VAGCCVQGGRMHTTSCHLAKIKSSIKKIIPNPSEFLSRFDEIIY
jgi:hypothetical protein